MKYLLLLLVVFNLNLVFACSDSDAVALTKSSLQSYSELKNANWDLKFEYDKPSILFSGRDKVVVFRAIDEYGDKAQGVMIWGTSTDYKCYLVNQSSLTFL